MGLDALLRDFRLEVPPGLDFYQAIYLGEPEEAEGVKLAVLKTKLTFRPNIVVSVGKMSGEDTADPLAEFVDEQLAILKKAPHHRLLERRALPGPRASVLIRQSLRGAEGVGVEQFQLYLAAEGNRVVIVTATHLAGRNFEKYEATFLGMIDTACDSHDPCRRGVRTGT
jgi:hypothetical protein